MTETERRCYLVGASALAVLLPLRLRDQPNPALEAPSRHYHRWPSFAAWKACIPVHMRYEYEPENYCCQLLEEHEAVHSRGLQLVCFSQRLSSLRRPSPQSQSAVGSYSSSVSRSDRLLSFGMSGALLSYLLSFLPNVDFFLRLPFLSHEWLHVYTDPALHRCQAQARFQLTRHQFSLFSERPYTSLHQPAHKAAYALRVQLFHDCLDAPDSGGSPDTEQAGSAAAVKKDWALECTHLYQHICFSQQVLTRHLPNITSTGLPIRWRLPRVLHQLLVDRLTARHVVDLLNHTGPQCREPETEFFLPLHYHLFAYRSSSHQPVAWSSSSQLAVRPSTLQESESVAGQQAEWQGEAEDMEAFFRSALVWAGNEDAARQLPELFPLAGRFCDEWAASFFHALWYGPALRHAVQAASSASSAGCSAGVTVELEHCPVVRVVTYQDFEAVEFPVLPQLIARDCEHWVAQGGLAAYTGQPTAEQQQQLRQWMDAGPKDEANATPEPPAAEGEEKVSDEGANMQPELDRLAKRLISPPHP